MAASQPSVPISWGELIDKITILEIKSERIDDDAKRVNVRRELEALVAERDRCLPVTIDLAGLHDELKAINEQLWEIEDAIRDCERAGDFAESFIALARAVYRTNDRRAAIKRRINDALGSALIEEKSYQAY